MAWETRARGGRYYRRSVREGGRVRKEYLGAGPAAEAIARLDALVRAEKAAKRQSRRDAEAQGRRLEQAVASFCETAELLARVALVAAGYHRHQRGEWRRRRGGKNE